jgi:hypothetical protein
MPGRRDPQHRCFLDHGHSSEPAEDPTFPLTIRAGTEEGQHYAKHIEALLKTARPFLLRWGGEPCERYETLSELVLREMQQPDFVTTWELHTIWGTVA